MPKKIELQIWEIRGNRKFLWYFWFSKNKNRKRPLVKVKCLECWEEKLMLKENFISWVRCKNCFQKIRTKEIANFKRTHWLWQTRFYHLFYWIKSRCIWKCGKLWKEYYYNRWIKCLWKTFEEFRDDMYQSYLDHVKKYWEKETTIDRIDNNGDYCKENCRWATIKEQMRNTTRNRFYDFNWLKLCEQDIKNITHEKKSQIRKKYMRIY